MNRTLGEWIEFYNKKAPEKFKRDERFTLFYLPDKGFCELFASEKIVLMWQVCGDGRFWKKFAEDVARKFNLKVCATLCTRREVKAWIRSFGFKIDKVEDKDGFKRYHSTDKGGNWGLMTEVVSKSGNHEYWVTWGVK